VSRHPTNAGGVQNPSGSAVPGASATAQRPGDVRPNAVTGPPPGPRGSRGRGVSGFWTYALRRALLIPVQLGFVLLILYSAANLPATFAKGRPGFLEGFSHFLVNNFNGNWGAPSGRLVGFALVGHTWAQVFAAYIPSSIQMGAFALPIAAALAYPVSLLAGWSPRQWLDTPARYLTLLGALLPVVVVGVLVYTALFFPFLNAFQDIPGSGLIPYPLWPGFIAGYPSWIHEYVTSPTGFPLVDALIHHAWLIAEITFVKTVIQASVVAVAYVAVFFRHARSIVRAARDSAHITGARAIGVSERKLLWRYAAKGVTPTFFLIFALTIPQFLGILFAVQIAFNDTDCFGYLLFVNLGNLPVMDALIFLIAIVVLVWTFVVDLIAVRLDPRGAMAR